LAGTAGVAAPASGVLPVAEDVLAGAVVRSGGCRQECQPSEDELAVSADGVTTAARVADRLRGCAACVLAVSAGGVAAAAGGMAFSGTVLVAAAGATAAAGGVLAVCPGVLTVAAGASGVRSVCDISLRRWRSGGSRCGGSLRRWRGGSSGCPR